MSREVDSRIVELQFNSENFEENTQKSISLIDKLMEKLKFKGAEDGFEKLDKAAADVDFSSMTSSLDTISNKFSALDVIATTALVNITNKAVNAGESLVKSLSVDQISSGWSKYAEKTANVQTIMNATGKSIDQVNGYLNKLMWYSDETSFSFDEMTSALSQMTASGGDIEKMIPMIMGIANATADAGKSGMAFQSTIRNLTQSYSAGYLQLTDWKSLNLMGTATKALKQELIDTAVELGKIKDGDVTIATFESSLSDKWADTEVMEQTFTKYASMMQAAYDMVQADSSLTTSDALEQLSGQYGELAERSALAAQQAKSFSEAIDSTKDAVSSKWMKTFELIFGNKEEATDTWTELANRLYDIFVPSLDTMNEALEEGLDSTWQQMQNAFGDQADHYSTILQNVALASGAVTEEMIEEAGSFSAALEENGVSAETLQTALTGAEQVVQSLLAMSDDELAAQNISRSTLQAYAEGYAQIDQKIADGTISLDAYADGMDKLSGREHLMQALWNIWDAIAKVMEPIQEAFSEIFSPVNGEQIYSFAEGLDDFTKKLTISDATAAKIKKTFKGVFTVIKQIIKVLETLGSYAKKVFNVLLDAATPVATVLSDIGAGLEDFVNEVGEAVTGSGDLKTKLVAIHDAFIKLISPVENLGSLFSETKAGTFLTELIGQSKTASAIFEKLSSAGKLVYNALSTVSTISWSGFGTLLDTVKAFAAWAGSGIADFISSITGIDLSGLPKIGDWFKSMKETAGNATHSVEEFAAAFKRSFASMPQLTNLFSAIKNTVNELLGDSNKFYRFLSLIDVGLLSWSIVQVSKNLKSLVSALKEPLTGIGESISGTFEALTSSIKAWQKTYKADTMIKMAEAMLILAGAMFVMSLIDPERFVTIAAAVGILMTLMMVLAKKMAPATDKFTKCMDALKDKLANTGWMFGIGVALAGLGIAIASITSGLAKLVATMQSGNMYSNMAACATGIAGIVVVLLAFSKATETLRSGKGMYISANALKDMAIEFAALGASVLMITHGMSTLIAAMQEGDMDSNIAALVVGMAGIIGIVLAMAEVQKTLTVSKGSMIKAKTMNAMSVEMLALGAAVKLIAGSLIDISEIQKDKLINAGVTTAAIVAAVNVTCLAMSFMQKKLGGLTFGSGAALVGIGTSVALLAAAMKILDTIPAVDTDKIWDLATTLSVMISVITLASSYTNIGSGVGVLLIANAMVVLAGAMAAIAGITTLDPNALTKFGISAGILAGIIVALALLKQQAVAAGKSAVLIAASLTTLSIGITIFAGLDWDGFITGCRNAVAGATLVGILMAAFSLLKVDDTLNNVASCILKISAALLIFAPAVLLISQADGTTLLQVAIGLTAVFGAFVAGGYLVGKFPLIYKGMMSIMKVFSLFGKTLRDLAIAGAITAILALFAGPIAETIEGAAPDIQDALITILNVLLNTISAISPALQTALISLITVLANTIIECAPVLADAAVTVVKEVLKAIAELLGLEWDESLSLFSIDDWIDAFTADDRPIGMLINWFKEQQEKIEDNTITQLGKSLNLNAEQARALYEKCGYYAILGYIDGTADPAVKAKVEAAIAEIADAGITTMKKENDEHSPSKVYAELGKYITLGLAEGISDESTIGKVLSGITSVSERIRNAFCEFWGIHSPSDTAMSDGENMLEGLHMGCADNGKIEEIKDAVDDLSSDIEDEGVSTMTDAGTAAGNAYLTALKEQINQGNWITKLANGNYGDWTTAAKGLLNKLDSNVLSTETKSKAAADFTNAWLATGDISNTIQNPKNINANGLAANIKTAKQAGDSTATTLWNKLKATGTTIVNTVQDAVTQTLENSGIDLDTLLNGDGGLSYFADLVDEITNPTTNPSGSGSKSSSSSGKTLAETIEEKYEALLKANKYLQDAADDEWELWELTTGDTADKTTLLEAQTEKLTKSIDLQTARVEIAQAQYDELKSKVGENDDTTKDAYSTLLSEKQSLVELQRNRIESMYEGVLDRYDSDASRAEAEYNLWSDVYEKTASVTEQQNEKIAYMNRKLNIQAEETKIAGEKYEAYVKEFGEESQLAQEAYTSYLEEQAEQQELQNEIQEQQLAYFDNLISLYDKQATVVSNRHSILADIYDDGELSSREDDYKSAVETYGEDSTEARKAKYQGTMSSIMSLTGAMQSMGTSLKKLTQAENKYDEAVKQANGDLTNEDVLDALGDWESEQSTVVSLAETIAEAFDMSDTGKSAMKKLGYTIAKNWRPIQNGMKKVAAKVSNVLPDTIKNAFSDTMGLIGKEGAEDTISSFTDTVVSMLSGDWGSAIVSAMNTVLNLLNTEYGQTLLEWAAKMAANYLPELSQGLSKLVSLGKTATGTAEAVATTAEVTGEAATTLAAAGTEASGLTGIFETLGTAISGIGTNIGGFITGLFSEGGLLAGLGEGLGGIVTALASIGPEVLVIGAVVAGAAALIIGNFDEIGEVVGNVFDQFAEIGANIINGLVEGIKNAWNAVCDFVGNIFSGITDFVCGIFGIHSPSRVFNEIGGYLMEGFAGGITEGGSDVLQAVNDASNEAIDCAELAAQRLLDAVDNDSSEPLIKPLVDLSAVDESAQWINGVFDGMSETLPLDMSRSASLADDVQCTSTAQKLEQARREEASANSYDNSDVVSAIAALGSRMDAVGDSVANLKLVTDTGKLVGELAPGMDEALGKIYSRRRR